MNEGSQSIKIMLIGAMSVGKSSIIRRYCDDYFVNRYCSTIGVDFRFKTVQVRGKTLKL